MNHNNHSKLIMVCKHVLEENKPIGDMDEECKEDTVVCQECIEKLIKIANNSPVKTLPKSVFGICKDCVIEKLKENRK